MIDDNLELASTPYNWFDNPIGFYNPDFSSTCRFCSNSADETLEEWFFFFDTKRKHPLRDPFSSATTLMAAFCCSIFFIFSLCKARMAYASARPAADIAINQRKYNSLNLELHLNIRRTCRRRFDLIRWSKRMRRRVPIYRLLSAYKAGGTKWVRRRILFWLPCWPSNKLDRSLGGEVAFPAYANVLSKYVRQPIRVKGWGGPWPTQSMTWHS